MGGEPAVEAAVAIVLVALGGGLGAVARFWLSGLIARRFGEAFALGTLVVNVSGAAAIGMLAALLLAEGGVALTRGPAWEALVIGFLGSYTTVSSFSLQTLALARQGQAGRALANIALSLVLCLAAAAAGLAVMRALLAGGGAE